jgi:hypothetical protein
MKLKKCITENNPKDKRFAMVKTLTIDCPHCKKTFEVFMSNSTSMVILNCPLCATPIVYYKTRCFVLNRNQIERIRKSRQDSTVLKILHSIAKEQPKARYSPSSAGPSEITGAGPRCYAHHAAPLPCTGYITKDDIINLRIELETCTGSQEFIDNL